MTKIAYEIRVEGELPPSLLEDFDAITILADPARTSMRAYLRGRGRAERDPGRAARAGLVLIDVRREQEPE